MITQKQIARNAGWWYLAMGITGFYGLMIVPSRIIDQESTQQTIENIIQHEFIYRLGIIGQLLCQIFFVFLVLELRRLFKEVSAYYSSQMYTWVMVSIPIAFLVTVNQLVGITLLSDLQLQAGFSMDQLTSTSLLFIELWKQGILLAQVFWGIWLIPFGVLVYKSRFIPRLFGLLLIIGGPGYILASSVGLLWPVYTDLVSMFATIPSGIAEIAIIFWLLIKGVRNEGTWQRQDEIQPATI